MTDKIKRMILKKRVVIDDLSCYSKNDKAYTSSYSIGKGKDERHYELDSHDVGMAYYDGELYFLVAYDRKWVIESTIRQDQMIHMASVVSNMKNWMINNGLH